MDSVNGKDNTIISSKEVPNSWKRGEIVRHFKKDSQLEKVNYNLLQFFQRFPRTLNISYINNWLTTLKRYFIKYMLGYRKYHGRPTALLFLTEQWKEDLDKHNISSARLPFI